jgi:hypothetical protein
MVIGPGFVIGHIGKTAGDAVKQIVESLHLPGVTIIPVISPLKHLTFRQWGGDLTGRELVLSIRRLPAFLLSQFHHRLRDGRLSQLPAPESMCQDYMADFYIRLYTDDGRLKIDHWLRSESIRPDLAAFLSRHFDLTDGQRGLIETAGTKRAQSYDHDVCVHFTPRHLQTMYAANPLWAEIERRVYGGLVEADGVRAAMA